MATSIYEANHL